MVLVKPNQDGSAKYKPAQGYEIKRHVSKLLVLVPVEEQEEENATSGWENSKGSVNFDKSTNISLQEPSKKSPQVFTRSSPRLNPPEDSSKENKSIKF